MTKLSFETNVTPSIDINTGEIQLVISNTAGQHHTEVMHTKDEAIRAALIALGWTSPTDKNTSSKNGRTLILVTKIYLDYFGSYTGRQTFRVDYDKFLVWKRESMLLKQVISSTSWGMRFVVNCFVLQAVSIASVIVLAGIGIFKH